MTGRPMVRWLEVYLPGRVLSDQKDTNDQVPDEKVYVESKINFLWQFFLTRGLQNFLYLVDGSFLFFIQVLSSDSVA